MQFIGYRYGFFLCENAVYVTKANLPLSGVPFWNSLFSDYICRKSSQGIFIYPFSLWYSCNLRIVLDLIAGLSWTSSKLYIFDQVQLSLFLILRYVCLICISFIILFKIFFTQFCISRTMALSFCTCGHSFWVWNGFNEKNIDIGDYMFGSIQSLKR